MLAGCYQVVCSMLKAVEAIVDATIINAPSSTKNADKARDPKTHQTKKGNQWSGARPQRLHCGAGPGERRLVGHRLAAEVDVDKAPHCRRIRKAPPLGQYRAVGDIGRCGHNGVDQLGATVHPEMRLHAEIPLSHGQETRVWGDQAYRGQRAVIREHAPKARDFTNRR